jgi:hypothetical protein
MAGGKNHQFEEAQARQDGKRDIGNIVRRADAGMVVFAPAPPGNRGAVEFVHAAWKTFWARSRPTMTIPRDMGLIL